MATRQSKTPEKKIDTTDYPGKTSALFAAIGKAHKPLDIQSANNALANHLKSWIRALEAANKDLKPEIAKGTLQALDELAQARGYGNWKAMQADPDLGLAPRVARAADAESDSETTTETRAKRSSTAKTPTTLDNAKYRFVDDKTGEASLYSGTAASPKLAYKLGLMIDNPKKPGRKMLDKEAAKRYLLDDATRAKLKAEQAGK